MKKALALILALVLCLGLCACVSPNPAISKEELLKMQEEQGDITATAICEAYLANPINAKDQYIGKVLSSPVYVAEICDEYITAFSRWPCVDEHKNRVSYKIYLSRDEIKQLEKKQTIQIIGQISNIEIPGTIELNVAYITSTIWYMPFSITSIYYDDTTQAYCANLLGVGVGQNRVDWYRFVCPVEKNGDRYAIHGETVKESDEITIKFTGKIESQSVTFDNQSSKYECETKGFVESVEYIFN